MFNTMRENERKAKQMNEKSLVVNQEFSNVLIRSH